MTLRHTATHCTTLQHTAPRCNTLQHAATRCNTLQHTATHCITATRCSMLQVHCSTLQHDIWSCICENFSTSNAHRKNNILDLLSCHKHRLQSRLAMWECAAVCCSVLQPLYYSPPLPFPYSFASISATLVVLWDGYDYYAPLNDRSLLQKRPRKKTTFCKRDL